MRCLFCDNGFSIRAQERREARWMAVPVKDIVDAGLLVNPDFRDLNHALAVNFFEAIHVKYLHVFIAAAALNPGFFDHISGLP